MLPPLQAVGYLNLFIAFLSISGANIIISRPRTSFNLTIYHLFYAIAIWAIFQFLAINAHNARQALWFYAFTSLGWATIPFFFFYLIYLLSYNRWQRPSIKFRIIFILAPVLLSCWIFSQPDKFYKVVLTPQGYAKDFSSGLAIFYYYWIFFGLVSIILIVFKILPRKDKLSKEQKKLISVMLYLALFLFGFHFAISEIFETNFILGPPLLFVVTMLICKYTDRLNMFKNYKELQIEYNKIKLIFENTQALVEIDDLNHLLKIIAENAQKATGSKAVAVTLFENEFSITKVVAGLDNPVIKRAFQLAGINPINLRLKIEPGHISWKLINEKKTIILKSFYEQIDKVIPKWLADLGQKIAGIKIMIDTPIIVDNECIGTIIYACTQNVDEEKIKFYEMFTNQASQAIKKARLIDEIKHANQELEKKVQERTRELELAKIQLERYSHHLEEEVEKQTKALREASEKMIEMAHLAGKAEVSAGVLHNIGNALNTIYVRMQRMEELCAQFDPESFQKLIIDTLCTQKTVNKLATMPNYLQKVKEYLTLQIQKLKAVKDQVNENFAQLKKRIDHINEILSLQKDYSKTSISQEWFQVNQVVEDAISMLDDSLQKRRIKVLLELDEDLPSVFQNRNQLLQIFINLIKNAIEALEGKPEKERWIKITTKKLPENNIEIIVEDNGVGIEEEDLNKIFEYGFSRKKDSQGIGLAISQYLVKLMKGRLFVESKGKDKGACFHLVLPVYVSSPPALIKAA